MAASDKNIVISPQRGSATLSPNIVFTGDGADPISIYALDGAPGALSFEGSAGQLFSITNNLTSGSIFSVNDVSGIPSLDIDADGTVSIASYGGSVGVGTASPSSSYKLDVLGDVRIDGNITITQTTTISGLNADKLDGLDSSQFLRSDANDTFTGTLTAGQNGKIVFPDNTTVPDSPTNQQHDYITFGSHGSISQVSGRGALMFASSDDSMIIANGDVGREFTNSNINVGNESIHLCSDNALYVYTDLQEGWGTQHTLLFDNNGVLSVNGNTVWHAGNDGSGSGLDADLLDGIDSGSFLRSDANDTLSAIITGHASNTEVLRVRSSSYSSNYIYIGGWSTANSTDISRIRSSGNLHIDGPSDGNLYLNWYASNRVIYLGNTGQTVYAAGSNTVWHAGNDGSGSGLDADTVDGIQASEFVTETEITNHSIDPKFSSTIGFGNDSAILYFNDATNTTRTGYWTNKDAFEIRGDDNSRTNVVLRTGNLDIDDNAYIGGILGIGGNVGIGTNNPTHRLTVDGSGTANTGITIASFRNANLQKRIDIIDETGTGQLPPGILSPSAGYGLGLYASNGPIRFYSNSTSDEKVRIDNSGNVGIGTTSPSSKVDIWATGDGTELLRFSSERQWAFKQKGSGSTTGLSLQTLVGNKVFYIDNVDGNTNISFHATTNTSDSRIVIGGNASLESGLNLQCGTVLVSTAIYTSNVDVPYLIAGTSGYTGETTNWDTYGIQHRFKSNEVGVPRITVDSSNDELLCINNSGNVGIGLTAPTAKLEIPFNGSIASETLRLGGTDNLNADYIYAIGFGNPNSTQMGIGPHGTNRSIWGREGITHHIHSNDEWTIKSSNWTNQFGVQGGTGNVYMRGNVGIGTTNPSQKLHVEGNIDIKGSVIGGELTGQIADDAMNTYTTPTKGGILAITSFSSYQDYPQPGGTAIVYYDVGPSRYIEPMALPANGSAVETSTNTSTTITDFTDGKLTIVVAATNTIRLVNRLGGTYQFKLTWL